MYAVGKVLYSVAGPFHPFGGAVDIVVVQQQDGSFKSSPWYVRFGKFQGVLKTKEKVVNIAVNGVQAGFHMYLDSDGVAHFLRDADSNIEEGDFVVSSASSRDEREAPMQDAQLRKSKSTSCDISTMEAGVGDGKTLARTITRQSTILERMFGQKSIKKNAHAVDRVSSIERAEIAAELLDTKWSTNLSCGSKACSCNDEPSSSHLTDAGYVNQVETTQMVLPDCSFDHDKMKGPNHDSVSAGSNFGSPHGGRRSPGDDNEHYVQTTSVKEDIVEINECKTGDFADGSTSTTVQPVLESLSNDLNIDNSINESIDTQVKLQGNSEDVTDGRQFTEEVLSHRIFEIHAIETNITTGESEAISHFVSVHSDGFDQNFSHTNSPTYSIGNLSSKKHDVSDGITSATDLRGSESLSNDLTTDNSINGCIDTEGELWGNSEDVIEGGPFTKEVHSHGFFQIHAIETDNTNRESEVISQFVALDSDGVDQSFSRSNSPTHTTRNLSSEKHDVSATDLQGSESLSNDLSTGNSINESIDTQGELQGNSEDVIEVELVTDEVRSHVIFEIPVIETDITSSENEVISQFVAVDGIHQNFSHTDSPTYTTKNLSSEKHDVSAGITSATGLQGSESLSNDLSTGNSTSELQGNSEDVIEVGLDEVRSHASFEIPVIETDITSSENEAISQFVAVDGIHQNFSHTDSPTYTTRNLSSEKYDVSAGITSATGLHGSESLSNDLSTDNSTNESIDTQGEVQCNSEDVIEVELFTEEIRSHGTFEIPATETGITSTENEAIAQFVAVHGVDQNFSQTNSPTYTTRNLSSEEEHDVSDEITSATDLRGSESLSNDPSAGNSINESVGTQYELEGKSEDVTEVELFTEEVPSHAIFEIPAFETGITSSENGAISQFVAVDSDGVNQNSSHRNSPTYTTKNLSSEKHDVSDWITSAMDLGGSESLSDDPSTGDSINKSIGTRGELLSNFEDVTEGGLFTKEVRSYGDFQIHAAETDITNRESETISQFIIVDPDAVNHNFSHTNSPTYTTRNLSSEKHDVYDGITSATDQRGSEALSTDLGNDKGINQSIDSHGEMLIDSEDFTGREMHRKEVLSHGIFEIHAIETDSTNVNSGLISQVVSVDSDGVDQNFTCTNSPPYIGADLSSERHDVSLIASSQDAFQEKVVILSSSEIVESSYDVSNILPDKVCDAVGMSLVDGVQFEQHSRVSSEKIKQITFEKRPLGGHGSSSNKDGMHNLDVRYQEISVFDDPSPRQNFLCDVPDKDISVDTIANGHVICSDHGLGIDISVTTEANDHSTHSAGDLACQRDLVLPDASSSVVEKLSYVHEDDPGNVMKYSTVKTKTCNGELDVSVTQTSTMEDGTTECIAQSADLSNKVDNEVLPVISDFSSLSKVEEENTKLEDGKNRSSSSNGVEIEIVAEEPRDETEAVVSFSESVEDIQFQFSDTGNFADRNTVDDAIPDKAEGAGVHDESHGDAEEKVGNETDVGSKMETLSGLSRPDTSHMPIPESELHSDDNNLEVISVPDLCYHINDLERSGSFQLRHSLQSNGENNAVDPVMIKNCGFPDQEPEGTGDLKETTGPSELINKSLSDEKHDDGLRIDSFSPFAELSLCRHLLSEGMGADAACKAFDAEKITLEKFRSMKESLIRNEKLVVRIAGRYFPWDVAAPVVLGSVSFREEQFFESQGMIKVERVEPITSQGSSWRIWPFSFRRASTINIVQPVCDGTVETSLSVPVKETEKETKRTETKVPSLTPTSEELASLDLREGKNVVTFTFSTSMLGRQQVDAHIYLWKWNARIVISDVDGTITKSDVLGQFMPMMGVDWSQNGVTHLFSAIKENGYQLLFLSARSISQAHITRQFLFNLKQDGKALPDGPVVISPDGLFPSLYREVIRRAPHEFKIACLGAIKALFPPDLHPFYAGFGNRDTDEFSYLKVGIPMGKIFIINPKGEVAVNRRVDTKSYTSLHALVNGMFPLISSSSEQEDYNTWNYWKMPLRTVD